MGQGRGWSKSGQRIALGRVSKTCGKLEAGGGGDISKITCQVPGQSVTDGFPGMSLPKCDWGGVEVNFVQSIGTCRWEVNRGNRSMRSGRASTRAQLSPLVSGSRDRTVLSSGPRRHY